MKYYAKLTSEQSAFLLMCCVYGLLSSMIPESFGIAELMLFLLLVVFVPILGVIQGFFPTPNRNIFQIPNELRLMLFIMFILPLVTGLIRQNDIVDITRDVLPFLFFLLPVFLYRTLQRNPETWIVVMCLGYSLIGVLMSIRHFSQAGASFADVGEQSIFGTGISLAFDPSVQFAFPFLLGMAIKNFFERRVFVASIFLASCLIPLFAILGVVARAPLALSLVSVGLMVYFGFRSRLLNTLVLAGFTILLAVSLAGENVISRSVGLMLLKHEIYGVSSRDLEVAAVLNNADTIDKFLLGEGWGGLIANPIGDGAMWRFVHNMYAYYFFKQGVVGLIFVLIYSYWLFKMFFDAFLRLKVSGGVRLIALMSLIPPLLGSFILEVTYKTLIFGLLLSLLVAITASLKRKGGFE